MKKIEIITKSNGKKKSNIVKIKNREDVAAVITLINYYLCKNKLPDLDLTESLKFKVDGKKVTASDLREALRNSIKGEKTKSSDKSKKNKKDKSSKKTDGLRHDSTGRVIIQARKTATLIKSKKKDSSKKKIDKLKKKKALNKSKGKKRGKKKR